MHHPLDEGVHEEHSSPGEGLPAWVRNSIIRNGIEIVNESKVNSHQDKGHYSMSVIPPSAKPQSARGIIPQAFWNSAVLIGSST